MDEERNILEYKRWRSELNELIEEQLGMGLDDLNLDLDIYRMFEVGWGVVRARNYILEFMKVVAF